VVIDDWLRSDLDAPRKQRHTAKRIFDRLLDEHDGAGVVSYWMVREYVATRRREIRIEVGREPANAFIPQEHLPGREAEVDFGDVAIRLRGELVTCALFSLRLSYSGKAVHRVSASAGQEAFFEGHVHAFNVLGGLLKENTPHRVWARTLIGTPAPVTTGRCQVLLDPVRSGQVRGLSGPIPDRCAWERNWSATMLATRSSLEEKGRRTHRWSTRIRHQRSHAGAVDAGGLEPATGRVEDPLPRRLLVLLVVTRHRTPASARRSRYPSPAQPMVWRT